MSFCPKCGTSLADDAKFCPSCGNATDAQATQNVNTAENQAPNTNTQQAPNVGAQQANQDFTKNPDGSYTYTGPVNEDGMYVSDVEKNKYLNILSYLGILFLIPLFMCKGSKYSRFHINQGIILCICEVAYNIAAAILKSILSAVMLGDYYFAVLSPMYGLYSAISTILSIVNLGFTALAIYGIYNAVTGKAKELPVIGKFRILK